MSLNDACKHHLKIFGCHESSLSVAVPPKTRDMNYQIKSKTPEHY